MWQGRKLWRVRKLWQVRIQWVWHICGAGVAYDTLAKVKIEVSTVTYFSV